MAILPWEAVNYLPGLWLYLLAAIPQEWRNPHLIYNFSWSGLNSKALKAPPKEATRFGRSLHHLSDYILNTDPSLGTNFMSKVDLAGAYMHIWV